jgi:hypothetical protein
MIEAIIGLAVLVGGIIAAFFAGKRRERTENDTDTENTRIATELEIRGAIRDADNAHDWRDRLHERE